MTASANIKTPQMTLPLLASVQSSANSRTVAAAAARQLSRLTLADLIATSRLDGGIVVTESLKPKVRQLALGPPLPPPPLPPPAPLW